MISPLLLANAPAADGSRSAGRFFVSLRTHPGAQGVRVPKVIQRTLSRKGIRNPAVQF